MKVEKIKLRGSWLSGSEVTLDMLEVLYNPLCSKCRQAAAFLSSHGKEHTLRDYLKEPLTLEELRQLSQRLALPLKAWMRESVDGTLEEQLQTLSQKPELLQRPIIVSAQHAVVARTPEALKSVLNW